MAMGIANEVKGKAETIGDKAETVLEGARDKIEDAFDAVQDKASELLETVKEKVSGDASAADPPPGDAAGESTGVPVEDTASDDAVDEEAEELDRHSQPETL
jgi:hypothetical protein